MEYILIHFNGNRAGEIEFDGFRQIESWCPQLPFDSDGVMFPENYCGLRIRYADSFQWWDDDNNRIGDEIEVEPIAGSRYFLDGITITGGFETCNSPSEWKFPPPLTADNKPPFRATTLVIGVQSPQNTIYSPAIEFLKSNGGLVKLSDLYDSDVPDKTEWLRRIGEKYPEYREVSLPSAPPRPEGSGSNHPIHQKARKINAMISFQAGEHDIIPIEDGIKKTSDKQGEYQNFKPHGGWAKLRGLDVSNDRIAIYYKEEISEKEAFAVYGDIGRFWKKHDLESGSLGFPRSDNKNTRNGGSYCLFEGGVVDWFPKHDAATSKGFNVFKQETLPLITDLEDAIRSNNLRRQMKLLKDLRPFFGRLWHQKMPGDDLIKEMKEQLRKHLEDNPAHVDLPVLGTMHVSSELIEFDFLRFHQYKRNGTKQKNSGHSFRVLEFRVEVKTSLYNGTKAHFDVFFAFSVSGGKLIITLVNFDNVGIDEDDFPFHLRRATSATMKAAIKAQLNSVPVQKVDLGDIVNDSPLDVHFVAVYPQENADMRFYFQVDPPRNDSKP